MLQPDHLLKDAAAKLEADLKRFEAAGVTPRPTPATLNARAPLPRGERIFRRVMLGGILGWTAFVFAWAAVTQGRAWEPRDWLISGIGSFGCALGLYLFGLFYLETGKRVWRRLRRRPKPSQSAPAEPR